MMHFRPGGDAYIGDMIPFFWDGEYHIFYLKRQGDRPYLWCHIKSTDLLNWQPLDDVVAPGDDGAPDARGCWTGCVVHRDGLFYCFYTGWNPDRPHLGKHPQTICLATSRDLLHWEKCDDNPILWPDSRWYLASDWRDPFVFYNEDAGEWWMVICARDASARDVRAGCLALATSPDLQQWTVVEPMWSGGVCYAAECPDVFVEDGRWYAIYSHGTTRYRLADAPEGPWLAAAPDTLDGPHVRAAKTLSDGRRRLLFGWVPTRAEDRDDGQLQWGGHMAIPRVLVPQADGALLPSLPAELAPGPAAQRLQPDAFEPLRGVWTARGEALEVAAPEGVAVARLDVPPDFALAATVELSGPAADAGVLVRMSPDGGAGRKIGVERSAGRLAIYRWESWGDPEPMISRPLKLRPDEPFRLHVVCHGSIIEAFVDGHAALAARCCHPLEGWLGLWVANGSGRISDVRIMPLEPLR